MSCSDEQGKLATFKVMMTMVRVVQRSGGKG